jgi:transposase
MSKRLVIRLSEEERRELEGLIRTGNASARTQTRARILLLSDENHRGKRTDGDIASFLLCSKRTVGNVRRRYREGGPARALYDNPRPGQKPKLTGELEAQLTVLACSAPPEGHARWSLRLLANQLIELGYIEYVSHVTVGEWLKKTNLSLGESSPGASGSLQPDS